MTINHTVKQGQHLSGIARQYGFTTVDPIWNHPENADVKKIRKHPHVLFPGDKLVIPDKENKTETAASEVRHRYRLKQESLIIRLVVQGAGGEPVADAECRVEIGPDTKELTTDGNGMIELPVAKNNGGGLLFIKDMVIPIKIGHLDPVNEQSGQKGRLNNLGYYAGELAEEDENMLKSAIEEFQCEHELKVDGICGPNTQNKLEEEFGY